MTALVIRGGHLIDPEGVPPAQDRARVPLITSGGTGAAQAPGPSPATTSSLDTPSR